MNRLIVGLAEFSRRHALAVALGGLLLAALSAFYAVTHLDVSTDTDRMFSSSLPWRQQADELNKDFPQFNDLLVAVIDAREPEQADATAAALADALAKDHAHFNSVRRPDASPFLRKEGLLFLDTKQLTDLMDRTIDAQPFLGQLVADPTARGLFSALSLLGMGVTKGDVDLGPYLASLEAFHQAMADALAGHPRPLSWQALLGGSELNDLAGKYTFVLAQPKLDFGALQPGGEATAAMRDVIADLEFVKSGDARVRITGQVALADEEFATVVQGAVVGLIGSVVLITLWLFLAVQTWRLIVPILATLGLGLMLTLLFASVAVGTLNLVSVGFGILFVGIAVDFAIQFSVRYRERRFEYPDPAEAMRQNAVAHRRSDPGRRGRHIGRLSRLRADGLFRRGGTWPDRRRRHADRLRLHAGVPARGHHAVPPARRGRRWSASPGWRRSIRSSRGIAGRYSSVSAALAVLAIAVSPRLEFDSDPLHTKNPNTEAMRTLYDLMDNPVTNPYSISPGRAERGGRRGAEGEAGQAAHRVEGDRHPELRAGRPAGEARDHCRCQLDPDADAAAAHAGRADHARSDPAGGEDRAGADRSGAGEAAEGPSAGRDRRRSAPAADRERRCAARHRPRADALPAGSARPAAHRAERRAGHARHRSRPTSRATGCCRTAAARVQVLSTPQARSSAGPAGVRRRGDADRARMPAVRR